MYSLPREIHREILSWLEPETQQITRLTNRYFAGLIQPQDINLLKFGAKRGLLEYCEIGLSRGNSKWRVCETAAKHGHLEVLQWARNNRCSWNEWICEIAARHGHLEVLQWARNNGCPWDEWTCARAAFGGHLEILKWARSQGCPWNEDTCSQAAAGGRLEVLQWARSQGCPWDSKTCSQAASRGHLEILKWAITNGCRWNYRNADIFEFPQHIQEYAAALQIRG